MVENTDPQTAVEDPTHDAEPTSEVLVDDELLVEDISIDGMCGVY